MATWNQLAAWINTVGNKRAAARMLGVSDGTIRAALGGRVSERGTVSQMQTRHYLEQKSKGVRLSSLRDTTPQGQKTAQSSRPRGTVRPRRSLVSTTTIAVGGKEGLVTGAWDQTDANGTPIPPLVKKQVSMTALRELLADAMTQFPHDVPLLVAFYGEFWPSGGYSANTKAGTRRGWKTKRLPGTSDPSGVHPLRAAWNRTWQDLLNLNSLAWTNPADKQREHNRLLQSFVSRFANDWQGEDWKRVFAVWIAPAKVY